MITIEQRLIPIIQRGLHSLYGVDTIKEDALQLQKTNTSFEGDITLVVFPLLRITKKSPEQSAQEIGEWLVKNEQTITSFNVVKGFLNLTFVHMVWINELNSILEKDNYGFSNPDTGSTLMVEYASPNTNKPLHLGHLRNIFLGDSVARILQANGHKVIKTQIINDRGIHICKSMVAWQLFGNGETPESSKTKGDHLIGKYYIKFDQVYKQQIETLIAEGKTKEVAEEDAPIMQQARETLLKWEAKESETYQLWETMNSWVYKGFDATYNTMGVDFNALYYESDTYILGKDSVLKGLGKGVFYKKEDGSVWCDLSTEKMDDKLLLRADGTSVYMTQDIGTAIERFKDNPDLAGLIYTVGNEQNHHFKVLFAILKKLGYTWAEGCHHLSYGMVDLPSGRMKSREGTVVDADDLMQNVIDEAMTMTEERGHLEGLSTAKKTALYHTIGMGGLKYYLLKVDPQKKMLFNPAESIDLTGNTGPFIQYTYARIQSILSNVTEIPSELDSTISLSPSEVDLVQLLSSYPKVIQEAGNNYSPALIANYCYELVKTYNSFYQSMSILKEENESLRNFRIALSHQVGRVVKSGMNLLGVSVPDRM